MEPIQPPTQPNKMNPMMIIGTVVVVVLIGFLFMSRKPATAPTTPSTEGQTETTEEPTTMEETPNMLEPTTPVETGTTDQETQGTVKTITMEAGSFYYSPNVIQVKKGDTVRINLTAKDMMHNFNIDELNVSSPTIKAGSSTTIEFVADKVGTFEYYCAIGQHRANGQVGKLVVQ